ncbi:hypothetical protein EDD11_007792 [Mortierella claussenii]|nr:hypothetical protein EDD11_007792 [Mortierella claussenii]
MIANNAWGSSSSASDHDSLSEDEVSSHQESFILEDRDDDEDNGGMVLYDDADQEDEDYDHKDDQRMMGRQSDGTFSDQEELPQSTKDIPDAATRGSGIAVGEREWERQHFPTRTPWMMGRQVDPLSIMRLTELEQQIKAMNQSMTDLAVSARRSTTRTQKGDELCEEDMPQAEHNAGLNEATDTGDDCDDKMPDATETEEEDDDDDDDKSWDDDLPELSVMLSDPDGNHFKELLYWLYTDDHARWLASFTPENYRSILQNILHLNIRSPAVLKVCLAFEQTTSEDMGLRGLAVQALCAHDLPLLLSPIVPVPTPSSRTPLPSHTSLPLTAIDNL